MIRDDDIKRACRARLVTLIVADTGPISIAASVAGGSQGRSAYIRDDVGGSFIEDGFRVGMEVSPVGFPLNAPTPIVALTALVATVKDVLGAVGAAGGRSLRVALPSGRRWENVAFDPTTGRPYFEEQYTPGPGHRASSVKDGWLTYEPQYFVLFNTQEGVGGEASNGYTDTLRALFRPDSIMVLPNGDILRVRGDVIPYASQLQNATPGWVTTVFTIPLRVLTQNSI